MHSVVNFDKGHNLETSICRIPSLCYGKKWLLIKQPKPDHDSGESNEEIVCGAQMFVSKIVYKQRGCDLC